MSLYKRGETWWFDIGVPGRARIRGSTGTADKAIAQRIHDERRAEVWQSAGDGRKTLNDAATAWLADGERSIKDRYRLRAILEQIGGMAMADITPSTIAELLAGQSAGNANRNRSMLLAVMNTGRQRGWLDACPHVPSRRVTAQRIRFLSAEEWSRLYTALPAHLQPMAAMAVATGLRRANVTHLEWSQIDMARRVLWIHPDQAKSGKPIGVPLSDDAMSLLRGQIGQHERWVFSYHGKPQAQITTAWKAALKRAGIEDTFRWHDLRHTWASWHVMAGTPLEVLRELGGWASLSMVMRYAHLAPDHLAQFAGNARPYSTNAHRVA